MANLAFIPNTTISNFCWDDQVLIQLQAACQADGIAYHSVGFCNCKVVGEEELPLKNVHHVVLKNPKLAIQDIEREYSNAAFTTHYPFWMVE